MGARHWTSRFLLIAALASLGSFGCKEPADAIARPAARYTLDDAVVCVAQLPDGDRAAVACESGKDVRLLDLTTGATLLLLKSPPRDEFGIEALQVFQAAVSPDGRYVAASGYDGCVLWRLEDRMVCHVWRFPLRTLGGLGFASNGRYLYATTGGDRDPVVLRLDVQTHEAKVIYRETNNRVFPLQKMVRITAFAVSPDASTLAVGVGGGVVLVDAETGATKCGLQADGLCPPEKVAFSPDGKLLAAGGGGVSIFDVGNGNMVAHYPTAFVTGLAFSPDGAILVSAGDGTVHKPGHLELWRVANGKNSRESGVTQVRL